MSEYVRIAGMAEFLLAVESTGRSLLVLSKEPSLH
jgi:hypothetical protein